MTGTETVTGVDFGFQPASEPLTVTVNQADGQTDPTNALAVHFTVVFSEAVSDFAAEDVTLSGTAPGTLVAVVSGSGTTYDVAVSGITDSGTVIASLAAGVAHSAAGRPNRASDGLDNQIAYAPWHNNLNPGDVDGNGGVEALDALVLINYINAHPGEPQLPAPPAAAHAFYDVNRDQACTANDVLLVINHLNRGENPGLEGEGLDAASPPPVVNLRTAQFLAAFSVDYAETTWLEPPSATRGEPAAPQAAVGVVSSDRAQEIPRASDRGDGQTASRLTLSRLEEVSDSGKVGTLEATEFDQLLSDLARELAQPQRRARQ